MGLPNYAVYGFFFLLFLFCMLIGPTAFGQTTDLARIEYTYIPQSSSDNSLNRFRAFINFPIRLKREGDFIIAGIEYRNVDFDFEDAAPFDVSKLDRFQLLRGNLAYTRKMKNDWRFAAKAGVEINSNFESDVIIRNDLNFSGAAFMIKDKSGDEIEKPWRLILGLNYSTNQGRPFPLPVINYFRRFHPNWSYSVGTPKTNLKYAIAKNQTLQSFVTLDGFFSNIQNNLDIPNAQGGSSSADNISMTQVLGGLGYEYYFTKNLLLYLYGGHTIFHEIRLRDNKRNNLYEINGENTFYIRTGIKFKI